MELKVNSGIWGTMFGVPCIVADNLLKLATGEHLKVLLFILRNSGRNVSDEEISLNTGVPVSQVQDSILFWQQVNVITPDNQAFSSPVMQMTAPSVTAPETLPAVQPQSAQPLLQPVQNTQPPQPVHYKPRKKENLNPSEITKIIQSSSEIKELFTVAEQKLGDLNHTMQNTIIWISNYLGLKSEVIITLITYCAHINKKEPRYIEKIACDWAEKEINTLDLANEEIERLKQYNEFLYIVKRRFEMKHTPTTQQQEFIKKWQSLGIDMELIHYAYEKCLENTEKLSFEYINKVVTSWHMEGLKTIEEVDEYNKKFKNSNKNNFSSGKNDSSSSGKLDLEKYKIFINQFE